MKTCTACQKKQKNIEFQEKRGDIVFDYFVCRTCREKATKHTIFHLKTCTACQKKQKNIEFQEKRGDMVFDYFVCRTCREKATKHTIFHSSEYIKEQSERLGL